MARKIKVFAVMFSAWLWAIAVNGAPVWGAGIFNIDRFGAKPNQHADSAGAFRDAIAAAIKAGGGEVRFGPGVYYLMSSPDKIYVAWPRNARNLNISGVKDKTELIVTDPTLGLLRFEQCTDCSLRNVICDYETPPFAQGRVVAVDKKAATFDIKLDAGFPSLDAPCFDKGKEWGVLLDGKERRLKFCNLDHAFLRDWQKQPEDVWRLVCRQAANITQFEAGDRFAVLTRSKGPTIFAIWSSSQVLLEDVVVHASPGITNGVVLSDAVVCRRFQVRFRADTNRLITSNGDGIHFHGNRRGPLVEECFFEGICDDGINLNVHMSPIARIDSPTDIVVAKGPVTFLKGDRVQIVDPATGTLKATTIVVEEKALPKDLHALRLKDAVPQIRANAGMDAGRGQRPGEYDARLTGDVLYNLSCANANYIIRNNTFRQHRRHGLLIRSGGGTIENNTFESLCGLGIVIENGGAMEGPMADGVIIRNNKLTAVGRSLCYGNVPDYGAISVRTNGSDNRPASGRAITNIRILNNQVIDPPRFGVYVGSATNVAISDTAVTATDASPAYAKSAAVCVENAAGVSIGKLTASDPRSCVEAGIVIRKSTDAGAAGVSVKDATFKLAPGVTEVLDQRQP